MSKEPYIQSSFLEGECLPPLYVYGIRGRLSFPRPNVKGANWENIRAQAEIALRVLDGKIKLDDKEELKEEIARVTAGSQPSLF